MPLPVATIRPVEGRRLAAALDRGRTFRSRRAEHVALPPLNTEFTIGTDLTGRVDRVSRLCLVPSRPADVRAWLSYDDGRTWTELRLDRRHQATVHHQRGKELVSLRVRATDRDGNSVEQTVLRAYGVR